MELVKKGAINLNNGYVEIIIKFLVEDTFDLSLFGKDMISIFNSNYYDVKIEDISDEIYKQINSNYKKYNIKIELILNNSIGYNKEYKSDNIIVLSKNKIPKGIILSNDIDATVYNINDIPDDIKNKILSSNDTKTPPPAPPQPTPAPSPTPPPTTPPSEQPSSTPHIDDIPSLNLNIDPDLSYSTDTSESATGPETPTPSTPPLPETGDNDKKIDISSSPVFNDIFDKTIKMMDNIGPSEDLLADLSRPDPSLIDVIKGHFGNKEL